VRHLRVRHLRVKRLLLGLIVPSLIAVLAACCPAPDPSSGGTAAQTGVAGVVRTVEAGGGVLELADGQRVQVVTNEALTPGERIFVTGYLLGDRVEATVIRRL
jgi:hypothetical protein